MRLALARARLRKVAFWGFLVLTFAAWVVAMALNAPWRGWFTIGFWALIGLGLIVRLVRSAGERRARLDAFHEFNQMYLGRTQSPAPEKSPAQSIEIGYPLLPSQEPPDSHAPESSG